MKRKLNFGMIGGGRGAFIGAVHMRAAQLDGMAQLVCGAFRKNLKQVVRISFCLMIGFTGALPRC